VQKPLAMEIVVLLDRAAGARITACPGPCI
jgi:hypothetical protein